MIRDTAVAGMQVEDAETSTMQEQKVMGNAEKAGFDNLTA